MSPGCLASPKPSARSAASASSMPRGGASSAASFAELRVEDICREAGLSKGSFYGYFEAKRDLLFELVDDDIRRSPPTRARARSRMAAPGCRRSHRPCCTRPRTSPGCSFGPTCGPRHRPDKALEGRLRDGIARRRAVVRGWVEDAIAAGVDGGGSRERPRVRAARARRRPRAAPPARPGGLPLGERPGRGRCAALGPRRRRERRHRPPDRADRRARALGWLHTAPAGAASLGVLVGLGAGAGAVAFRYLILWFTEAFSGQRDYSAAGRVANPHVPWLGVAFVVLAPASAACCTGR